MDGLIVHAVSYNVKTRKICAKNKTCMSAVKYANLSLFVRSNLGYNMNVYSGLLEWKLIRKPFRALYIPYAEYLAHIKKRIFIAVFFFKLGYFFRIAYSSGNYTINKS